jgi:hypothetical protein
MLLPIRAICDRRSRRDGTNAINIQYCFSTEKRTVLPTNFYVPARFWNRKQQAISEKLPATFGKAEELNEQILLLLRRTEDMVRLAKKKSMDQIAFLKEHFSTPLTISELEEVLQRKEQELLAPTTNLDFFYQIDQYILPNPEGLRRHAGYIQKHEIASARI